MRGILYALASRNNDSYCLTDHHLTSLPPHSTFSLYYLTSTTKDTENLTHALTAIGLELWPMPAPR